MMDWRQSLAGVDEDYLVGISNKGIVKRAYKDLEAEGGRAQDAAAALDWQAQELTVAAGGENVTIRLPLGESRCSCPSRSICRHVIMAILLARQAAAGAGPRQSGDSDEPTAENFENSSDSQGENLERNGSPTVDNTGDNSGSHGTENSSGSDLRDLSQKVWQEILSQPRKPLLRALGIRGLRRLAAAMETGQIPQVERGTVVRMQLPGQDMTVKLLSPLEYSTCTCHKKELCSHKAEAILWCQYMEKQLTAGELAQELEQQPDLDLEELSDTAKQVGSCLEHLLETGLARSGAQQAQELERLAILCHNAGLPGWEGDIRALAEGYEKYLCRAAGQTMERLAGQLQQLYDKTMQLKELADSADSSGNTISRIQALAGEFRSEYLPVGDLELTGITMEHFVSDSGYEGDTVYFLDTAAGVWYTYTNARPTFYEGKKRKGYQEKAPAPWGISLPLEGLARVRLLLRGAKCDAGGRLSSSQETRGEILGKSELTAAGLKGWYYRAYDRLFAEQIPKPDKNSRTDHPCLVFVQATDFEQGRFNEITQKLELSIWDRAGRQVLVELPYSKRDEASIRYLERLERQQNPCFLGRVYLRDSQVCLYPVDILERQELEQINESTGEENDGGGGTGVPAQSHDKTACQALQSYLEEVSWLLQEVYQVGSNTVQDSTLEALKHAEKQGAAYGMTMLSDWLRQLGGQLSGARHQLRRQSSEVMRIYCRLWQYVWLCRQRTAYDMARLSY